jgi:peroxiredoxin Q/BCP
MNKPSTSHRRRLWSTVFVAIVGLALPVAAVEIGQVAPDFSLDATTGGKVSLSQFRGKQAVLIEFYGADFAPV